MTLQQFQKQLDLNDAILPSYGKEEKQPQKHGQTPQHIPTKK